jgi:hypothetical protein
MGRIEASKGGLYNCQKHGILDSRLPCPWPNCANGHADEDLIVSSTQGDQQPLRWRRHQWQGQDSVGTCDQYYSWVSDLDYLNVSASTFVAWSEVRRRVKDAAHPPPNVIYHYTNHDGLSGIVASGELWMSDSACLNDPRDTVGSFDGIVDIITEIHDEIDCKDCRDIASAWILSIPEWKERNTGRFRVCLSSFSANGDDPCMRRKYGDFAIGFSRVGLLRSVDSSCLQPVIYKSSIHKQIAEVYIKHILAACNAAMLRSPARAGVIKATYLEDPEILFGLTAFLKDPEHSTEKEHRLLWTGEAGSIESPTWYTVPLYSRNTAEGLVEYIKTADLRPSLYVGVDDEVFCRNCFRSSIAEVIAPSGVDDAELQQIKDLLDQHSIKVELTRSAPETE